ncbi:hypothetical protein [Flavobacterium cerinum]|uniref:Uncharacterized protein n=1 Tax=Flavobacterium cerinum TaxID=2502784 RepID=A0A444HEQ1_9FLAO|nr:hypothetical protein [Flavobacterium cerinum]RWX03389.1 hypothetical protein EPI11_00220 [Flavobacterium cerinum]
MNTADYTPKYKAFKFNNQSEFDIWLEKTTAYVVEFFDDGQDLLKIYVAENNEIIHSEYFGSAHLYNGAFIVENPVEFHGLKIYNPNYQADPYYLKFTISNISKKKENEPFK